LVRLSEKRPQRLLSDLKGSRDTFRVFFNPPIPQSPNSSIPNPQSFHPIWCRSALQPVIPATRARNLGAIRGGIQASDPCARVSNGSEGDRRRGEGLHSVRDIRLDDLARALIKMLHEPARHAHYCHGPFLRREGCFSRIFQRDGLPRRRGSRHLARQPLSTPSDAISAGPHPFRENSSPRQLCTDFSGGAHHLQSRGLLGQNCVQDEFFRVGGQDPGGGGSGPEGNRHHLSRHGSSHGFRSRKSAPHCRIEARPFHHPFLSIYHNPRLPGILSEAQEGPDRQGLRPDPFGRRQGHCGDRWTPIDYRERSSLL
jgi:hypothetical protein